MSTNYRKARSVYSQLKTDLITSAHSQGSIGGRRSSRQCRLLLCLLAGILVIGCTHSGNGGPPRTRVFGKVTFQGKPIPFGVISFIPDPGANLPADGATIRNGQYVVDNNGGIQLGGYQIQITGWSQDPGEILLAESSGNKSPPVQMVPEEYNTKSKLRLVVESTTPIQKDFTLD